MGKPLQLLVSLCKLSGVKLCTLFGVLFEYGPTGEPLRRVSLYRQFGLTALARKKRTDTGQHREISPKLKEAIEGIALQKPPIPVAAICRQARRLAQDLGEEPPSYWLVYRIVAALPADLVTLAHDGTKAYSNAFELVHRREADGRTRSGKPITPARHSADPSRRLALDRVRHS